MILYTTDESRELKKTIGLSIKEYLVKHPNTNKLTIPILKEIFKLIDFNSEIPF